MNGGLFELWNNDMTKGIVKLFPIFTRLVLFSTTSNSYHGHLDRLRCPENTTRNRLLYIIM